jgi:hypothetical protein
MKTVRELFARDLNKPIEEIVKVNQVEEQTVYDEITEYVATDSIKNHFRTLLKAIGDAPTEPHEGMGVWISGFFGSGKSSFAKNLGYMLQNPIVKGYRASDLFKTQLNDPTISNRLDYINTRFPAEAIMFDVSVDQTVISTTERLTQIIYTVLLRTLDYAENYDVAELEIELEGEGKLPAFVTLCQQRYGDWRMVRKGAQKLSRASALLHEMEPNTFPEPDSWSKSLQGKPVPLNVNLLVQRAFDLSMRRCPGKALVFIIDEVGQYVARSAEKIEDLRAIVEQFGKESKNRLKEHRVIAPIWMVVTAQEKLEEVVAQIEPHRIELARLQDRFKFRIDLSPADIQEVASRRVLAKKPEAIPVLQSLYNDCQGQLNMATALERTARKSATHLEDFVQFYPYLPHFVELSVDIVSGIRLQSGSPKHVGGSNRTIIKQAYEMLVSPRTGLGEQPIGALVTLDKIYELVEGNLSSERQKEIIDIAERSNGANDNGMAVRVAKAICLMELVRDLPRTDQNVAALLVSKVGDPAPRREVTQALEWLKEAKFVRQSEEGWKMLSPREQNWQTEKGSLASRPRERNDILREMTREVFTDPNLKTYRFQNLRNFAIAISLDGVPLLEEGKIPLSLHTADDPTRLDEKKQEIREASRLDKGSQTLFWVFPLQAELESMVEKFFASDQMVKKYDQMAMQGRLRDEEAQCLQDEKAERNRLQITLHKQLLVALEHGVGLFRGNAYDGFELGKRFSEMLKGFCDQSVPTLYPNFSLGAKPLKGNEAEELLKAAHLNGLPTVFYGGEDGLNLISKEGDHFVPNAQADTAREILTYLKREAEYGNSETRTGKALERFFGGLGYGWDQDLLRLVLAVLFRGAAVDITYNGRRYESYQDPLGREPFAGSVKFRNALFTPVQPIDLRQLTQAEQSYEALTGQTVDVDQASIAQFTRQWAEGEERTLLQLGAHLQGNQLPKGEWLGSYQEMVQRLRQASPAECVKTLAGEGKSLLEFRKRAQGLRQALTDENVEILRRARVSLQQLWPPLRELGEDGTLKEAANQVSEILASEQYYEMIPTLTQATARIAMSYANVYQQRHSVRVDAFRRAIEEVQNLPEWSTLAPETQTAVLKDLRARACDEEQMPAGIATCPKCRSSLAEMSSDLAAVSHWKAQAIEKIHQATEAARPVERVRLSSFFAGNLESPEAIKKALERLSGHLLDLVEKGVRIVLE